MRARQFILMAAVLWCAACEDRGVVDPEQFFRDNRPYLESVASRLRQSGLMGIWGGSGKLHEYENASKYYTSVEDEALYGELRAFIRDNELISIQVVRLLEGKHADGTEDRRFVGISFAVKHVRTRSEGLKAFDIAYMAPGERPEKFYWDPSCRPLGAQDWHLCEWAPK